MRRQYLALKTQKPSRDDVPKSSLKRQKKMPESGQGVNQEGTLRPYHLFEPAVILGEPGRASLVAKSSGLKGQDGQDEMAPLHFCYTWQRMVRLRDSGIRMFVGVWTDAKGELLDHIVLPNKLTESVQEIFEKVLERGLALSRLASHGSDCTSSASLVILKIGEMATFEFEGPFTFSFETCPDLIPSPFSLPSSLEIGCQIGWLC